VVIESYCTERKIKKTKNGDFINTARESEVNEEFSLHVAVIFVYYLRRNICSFSYLFLLTYSTSARSSGSRSETPGKFWNVVLEKDGKDQLD
jgi:hypothetical protein